MTFAETETLMTEINAIEVWACSLERERSKEAPDWERVAQFRTWMEEAKQTIFQRCAK